MVISEEGLYFNFLYRRINWCFVADNLCFLCLTPTLSADSFNFVQRFLFFFQRYIILFSWCILITETTVIFYMNFLAVYLDWIFHIKLKRAGHNAHILTVYHQRIIRKTLIYGNVTIVNYHWWWVMNSWRDTSRMTLSAHLWCTA